MVCPSQKVPWVQNVGMSNTDGVVLDCLVTMVYAVSPV